MTARDDARTLGPDRTAALVEWKLRANRPAHRGARGNRWDARPAWLKRHCYSAWRCGFDAAWFGEPFPRVYELSRADYVLAELEGYETGLAALDAALKEANDD